METASNATREIENEPESSLAREAAHSPFVRFSAEEWGQFRADTPLTLTEDDLERVRGINEAVSLDEVEEVYLPLSRLLNLYVAATQELYDATATFLGRRAEKVPYIIGLAGSVAVGKSTTARILQMLLSRWPDHPKVDLVTTDGFLLPRELLEERQLMDRKGFPESYDTGRLLRFVSDVKAGIRTVRSPLYSHVDYDIVPGAYQVVDQPDIMILEGLNVLQPGTAAAVPESRVFVSDYFDFSIYVDADPDVVQRWYVERFLTFRDTAFRDPGSFFHRYSKLDEAAARRTATEIWKTINEPNLIQNIAPTKNRADLILRKGADHRIERVRLRKL